MLPRRSGITARRAEAYWDSLFRRAWLHRVHDGVSAPQGCLAEAGPSPVPQREVEPSAPGLGAHAAAPPPPCPGPPCRRWQNRVDANIHLLP